MASPNYSDKRDRRDRQLEPDVNHNPIQAPKLTPGVATLDDVDFADPAASITPIDAEDRGELRNIVVTKTAGATVVTADVAIYDNAAGSGNPVAELTGWTVSAPLVWEFVDRPVFENAEDPIVPLLYVVISPNVGTDNDFSVELKTRQAV